MPHFERLLMAVTRNGQLQPSHFRVWARCLKSDDPHRQSLIPGWLLELADTLEEIYAEVTEKYEEEEIQFEHIEAAGRAYSLPEPEEWEPE